MSEAAELRTGKGHKDENFPVASFILKPEHRGPVMAFYRFARTADDVADHATASEDEKLALLEAMRATLAGERDDNPEALGLRRVLGERGLSAQHGFDLLKAFTQDVTKRRYASWAELMDYCRYSASPVGRFVLDVSRPFAAGIGDGRLAYEVALIQRLAESLTGWLEARDPLSQRVHHRPWDVAGLAALALVDRITGRGRTQPARAAT